MITKQILFGMKLWALQLVPSLFPFMILTKLYLWFQNQHATKITKHSLYTSFCRLWNLSPSGFHILILGHICGYPTGAQMISSQFKQHKLTKKEADYLMTLSNQSSPAFIISYFISYALEQSEHTIYYLFLLYISTFFTSLFTRHIYKSKENLPSDKYIPKTHGNSLFSIKEDTLKKHALSETATNKKTNTTDTTKTFFDVLDDSIQSSAFICIKIGGYIILFSALSAITIQLFALLNPCHIWITSALELTYGLSLLKNLSFHSIFVKNIFLLGCFSFGGFCTMAQIKGMLTGTSLSIKPYIAGKCIYTLIVLILYTLFQLSI